MVRSLQGALTLKSYQSQAGVLFINYVLADPSVPYASVLCGILSCKLVYDLIKLSGNKYLGSFYNGLTKIQRIEWNNRGMSTLHAIFITFMSCYFIFWSELFSSQNAAGLVIFRSSHLSTFVLGMSVGYFVADLGMICWLYPSLGGLEYILHHSISAIAVSYSMFTGEGQLYTFLVLLSEMTTPGINLRWFLDVTGFKRSNVYLFNGVAIFLGWFVVRILLFVCIFTHIYVHHAEVMKMHTLGSILVLCVPTALACMNLMWFWKIVKGLKKTLAKKENELV